MVNNAYRWEKLYFEAVLETDDSKLSASLSAAEGAIADRYRELKQDGGGTPEERNAIAKAVHGLIILRNERLPQTGSNPFRNKQSFGQNLPNA